MPFSFAALALAAFVAGVINAVAGGGAFVTFPTLLLVGVPPVAANATSTVALFPGQSTSALAYRDELRRITGLNLRAVIGVSLAGGLVGALLLLLTPGAVFAGMVPWLLLFATLVFGFGNLRRVQAAEFRIGGRALLAVQFAIAVYGGYFGGGIGFLMLAALTLYGLRDVHAMNGLKILLATLLNGAAVVAFVAAGANWWPQTLVMAAASVAGGYAGARGARRINQKALKGFIVVLGLGMSAYYFWHRP